ncbi:MAG: CheR family methyltransferase [Pontibacterium sp.]
MTLSTLSVQSVMDISVEEFERFAAFLEQRCGILLSAQKTYLVQSRLNKILKEEKFATFTDLLNQLESDPSRGRLQERVLDAMTTNETLWFRDTYPFEILKNQIFVDYVNSKSSKPMRIWSAACSTGQEPYSISMCVDEYRSHNAQFSAQVLATDICTDVLSQAKTGSYDSLSIGRGLSLSRLERYFEKKESEIWQVKTAIRSAVSFSHLNLLGSYSALGELDVIFCRNVLIYFSAQRKEEILTKMHQALKPGGVLILGASESIGALSHLFKMEHCRPGILYRAL